MTGIDRYLTCHGEAYPRGNMWSYECPYLLLKIFCRRKMERNQSFVRCPFDVVDIVIHKQHFIRPDAKDFADIPEYRRVPFTFMEPERVKDDIEMPEQGRIAVDFLKPVGLVAQHADFQPRCSQTVHVRKHRRPERKPRQYLFTERSVAPGDSCLFSYRIPERCFINLANEISSFVDEPVDAGKKPFRVQVVLLPDRHKAFPEALLSNYPAEIKKNRL